MQHIERGTVWAGFPAVAGAAVPRDALVADRHDPLATPGDRRHRPRSRPAGPSAGAVTSCATERGRHRAGRRTLATRPPEGRVEAGGGRSRAGQGRSKGTRGTYQDRNDASHSSNVRHALPTSTTIAQTTPPRRRGGSPRSRQLPNRAAGSHRHRLLRRTVMARQETMEGSSAVTVYVYHAEEGGILGRCPSIRVLHSGRDHGRAQGGCS